MEDGERGERENRKIETGIYANRSTSPRRGSRRERVASGVLKYPLDPFSLQKNVWPFVCSALLPGFGSVNDSRKRFEKNVIPTFVSGDGMFCCSQC